MSFLRHNKDRVLNDWEDIDHIDANRSNNDISNLQVLSQAENTVKGHQIDHDSKDIASRISKSRRLLTQQQVLEIKRRRESGESYVSISKDFGITPEAISMIYRNKTYKY